MGKPPAIGCSGYAPKMPPRLQGENSGLVSCGLGGWRKHAVEAEVHGLSGVVIGPGAGEDEHDAGARERAIGEGRDGFGEFGVAGEAGADSVGDGIGGDCGGGGRGCGSLRECCEWSAGKSCEYGDFADHDWLLGWQGRWYAGPEVEATEEAA